MFARRQSRSTPHLPPGERIYAIGDVHGEAALLERLLARILNDCMARGPARTTLVLLGDIIDRGADAAALLLTFARISNPRLVVLKGNHEVALVDCYQGDEEALSFWIQFGGRSTLTGLGIAEQDVDGLSSAALIAMLQANVDAAVIDWADGLPTAWTCGDYFFAHAGVRPGIALDRQDADDLVWIREPFLSSPLDHGKIVVHGHTIEPGTPRLGGNRIGLDTGAHEHGTLTALGLEGDRQWILQAHDPAATGPGAAMPSSADPRPDAGAARSPLEQSRSLRAIERLVSAIAVDLDPGERPVVAVAESDAVGDVLSTKADQPGKRSRRVLVGGAVAAMGVAGVALIVPADWARHDGGRPPVRAVAHPAPTAVALPPPPVHDRPPAEVVAEPDHPALAAPATKRRGSDRTETNVANAEQPSPRPKRPRPSATPRTFEVATRAAPVRPAAVDASREPAVAASPDAAVAVHLTGEALQRALAEDRAVTRRLNEDELTKVTHDR